MDLLQIFHVRMSEFICLWEIHYEFLKKFIKRVNTRIILFTHYLYSWRNIPLEHSSCMASHWRPVSIVNQSDGLFSTGWSTHGSILLTWDFDSVNVSEVHCNCISKKLISQWPDWIKYFPCNTANQLLTWAFWLPNKCVDFKNVRSN